MKKIDLTKISTRRWMLYLPASIYIMCKLITFYTAFYKGMDSIAHLMFILYPMIASGVILIVNAIIIISYDSRKELLRKRSFWNK